MESAVVNIITPDWAEIGWVLSLRRPVVLHQTPLVCNMTLALEFLKAILTGYVSKTEHALLIFTETWHTNFLQVLTNGRELLQHFANLFADQDWHMIRVLQFPFLLHFSNSQLHTIFVNCVDHIEQILSTWYYLLVILEVLVDVGIVLHRIPHKGGSKLLPLRNVFNPIHFVELQ